MSTSVISTDAKKNGGSRLSALTFAAIGLVTAVVGLWQWQPLPSDPKSINVGAASPLDARSYLRARPFDPVAYVGLAHELSTGQPTTVQAHALAQEALRVAAQLAPVDPIVIRARIADAYARKNLRLVMTLSADLAALSPADRADSFALLMTLMRTPEWPAFFSSRLSKGWPAANAFVTYVCGSGGKTDILLPLATAVAAKFPLTTSTLNCVLAKATAENQTPSAYWIWLNAAPNLPKKIPFVFNGDFESPLTGGPFDWTLGVGGDFREGFTVNLVRDGIAGSNSNAYLMVRFNGRAIKSYVAQQNLALTPGKYSLAYRSHESGLAANKLAWTIRCGTAPVTGTSSTTNANLPRESDWTVHYEEFSVPPTCSGQVITLEVPARLDTLQGLLGTAKYDDVIVKRL